MIETRDRGSIYETDIPSLSASLEAFDPERSMHTTYSGRSGMQSSSRWSVQDADESDLESDGPWAPPAWQKSNNNWYRKSLLSESAMRPSPSRSAASFMDRSDRDVTPSRIPLPESPLKHTPRTSPEPELRYRPSSNIASRMQSPSEEPYTNGGAQQNQEEEMRLSHHEEEGDANLDGFVRFAVRGETLFRTAPIEDTMSAFATAIHVFTKSKRNITFTLITIVVSWLLIQPWTASVLPDVVSVVGMAKQYELLVYASENAIPKSRELYTTSIAVEDLSESIRVSNMSASKTILDQLDGLSANLKTLSKHMRRFFVSVDVDIDDILNGMEWTKRQLESIQEPNPGKLDIAIGNIHGALNSVGLLERNGSLTAVGGVWKNILGRTSQQRAIATLQRTFDYFLAILEARITDELEAATVLFELFDSVEGQFHNLHRSVAKEEDSLSTEKEEFLAKLWRNNAGTRLKLQKFEKNLNLLKTVRTNTIHNKNELHKYLQIINSVKDQLDGARKNLVSPLIRRSQTNTYGVEQQLASITGMYDFLQGTRDIQKRQVTRALWGTPAAHAPIEWDRVDNNRHDNMGNTVE